jgi:Cu(I)/Ag(I) efflux system periplasmic protein CusF
MKCIQSFVITAIVSAVTPFAALASDDHKDSAAQLKSVAATPMTQGEVKKVDKDSGKVTIKHGPLTNLDMPAMTMVFRVKDAAMLDQLKAGDKIKFEAEKIEGAITVKKFEMVK